MKQKLVGIIIITISLGIYWFRSFHKISKVNPINEWRQFELLVRDGKIDKSIARQKLKRIKLLIDIHCKKQKSVKKDIKNFWVFPLENYGIESIGGKEGNGFQPDIVYGPYKIKGYNFFDGDKHGGHPAHDIFIIDKNQDGLDDRTNLPVNVLSMKDCIVLSTTIGWKKGDKIRGGNYIWTYDYVKDIFIYYAHLDKIFVQQGEFVHAGEKIGTVGRSGFLANGGSSPTHLHLMVLEYKDGDMHPYNFYDEIVNVYGK